MKETKEFLVNYLKSTGADQATLDQFNEVYDKEVSTAIQAGINQETSTQLEDRSQARETIANLAAEANIRRGF